MGLGINSSIHVAGMGMGAAEKMISVVGDNLANANTVAFKSGRADFSTVLSYTYSYGAEEGRINTAGANPTQIGMGVTLSGVSRNMNQGSIKEGMGKNDIAISGEGFLIAQSASGKSQYYTRNGSLDLNAGQNLITADGMYIMGYGVNDNFELQTDVLTPINIPVNKLNIAEATENTVLSGILDAEGPQGEQGTVLRTKQMTDLSKSSASTEKLTATQLTRPAVVADSAAATTAGGNMASGDYIYRIAYVGADGVESDYSDPIRVTVASGQDAVTLSDLPAVQGDYSSLRIYRAQVSDPDAAATNLDYYLVEETAPTATYTDTRATEDIIDPDNRLETSRLNGTYQYYVTFVDAEGNESRPSLISDARSLQQGGQMLLSDIPTVDPDNNPDNWTGRKIYRTTGSDTNTLYLVSDALADNLDPNAAVIDRMSDDILVQQQEFSPAGRGNVLVNEDTRLVDIGQYNEDGRVVRAFETGTLVFEPNKGATDLKTQTLEITEDTTVRDYLDFLNEAYGLRTRAEHSDIPADKGPIGSTINNGSPGAAVKDGAFYILGNSGEKNALAMQVGDMYMQDSKTVNDLGWTGVQEAVGTSTTAEMLVYDSLGAAVSVRMTLVLEQKTNTETIYRWYADSADNMPAEGSGIDVGTGLLRFDQHGNLIDTGTPQITVQRNDIASESPATFTFHMDLGGVSALATGSPEITQVSQDGAGAGVMHDYAIQGDGTILGLFTSNVSRVIGQIVLATFTNPEGLVQVGDSLYQESMNSGQPVLRTPTSVGAGEIKSYALEMSNTDIGQDLIEMILASAMYRANTKVLTTSNEMFDELMRIR